MGMRARGVFKRYSVVFSVVVSISCSNVFAWEGEYSIRLSTERDDNVTLAVENEESSTTKEAQLGIDFSHVGSRVTADIGGTVNKQNFSSDGVDSDETQIEGRANVDLEFIPSRFSWRFENSAAVGLIDARAADTPDNRTQTNRMSTGPNLSFLIAPATVGFYQYRLEKESLDSDSTPDNERQLHLLGVSRSLTRTLTGGITLDRSEFDSDNDGVDNTRDSFSLNLTKRFTGSVLSLAVGQSEVEVDQSGATSTSDTYSVAYNVPITSESSLSFTGVQRISDSSLSRAVQTDAAEGSGGAPSVEGTNPFNNLIETSIVEEQDFNATYVGRPLSANLEVQFFKNATKELDTDSENDRNGYFVGVRKGIGLWVTSLGYTWEEFEETGSTPSSTESTEIEFDVSRLIGRSIAVGGFVRSREETDVSLAQTAESNSIGAFAEITF